MDRGYHVNRRKHPKDIASIFSLLTFSYIHPLIKRGNQKDLDEDDMCEVWTELQSEDLGDKIETLWNQQKVTPGQQKSVFKLLRDCFWKKYLILGLLQLAVKITYVTLTPLSVSKLVSYFKEGQTEVSKQEAWMYGMIVIFTNSVFLFYEHHYILLKSEMAMRMVSSLSSLIYRKTLKLSTSKLVEISTGKIVTAITKDISQVEEAAHFLNDLWVEFIQAIVVMYLLHLKLGISGLTGLSIIIFIVLIQIYIASLILKKRRAANNKTDERLQLTQEIITSIKVLKMYAWEKFFATKVIDFRKREIRKLRTLAILKFTSDFLGNLCNKLSFLFLILCYIWFGNNLSAEVVYYITTCFFRLRRTIEFIIPYCCAIFAELIACLKRVELILNADEIEQNIHQCTDPVILPKIDFIMADVKVGDISLLKGVSLKLKPGLNILIGPVGSGKSSLLKAILKEYTICKGKMDVKGSISYSPQKPWLFPSSIKQNILFGQTYNTAKYRAILEACALSFDIDGLAVGDETILNDCGVNLSKGQQARINIARALYKESDIYILDDSLSSLDSHVKSYVFKNSIQNYLKNKLIILSTHDNRFIRHADNVIIMLNGTVTYSGKPIDIPPKLSQNFEKYNNELCESNTEKYQDTNRMEEDLPPYEDTKLLAKTSSTNGTSIYHEILHTGAIGWKDYKKYFTFGGGFTVFVIVIVLSISVEALSGLYEKLLSKWVSMEEEMTINSSRSVNSTESIHANMNLPEILNNFTFKDLASSTTQYSNNSGINTSSNFLPESTTMKVYMTSSEDLIETTKKYLSEREFYIHSYSASIVTTSVLVFITNLIFFIFSLKISKNLHKSMISNVLGATMSFFDVNMSGNILNRFSKDLYAIDEWVPFVIYDALNMVSMLMATCILIATISIFFSVMTIVLVLIFLTACCYFIKPARTLRRLCSATRSPLVGHLNATLEGLVTIRAYGTQKILMNEYDKHQDLVVATTHLFEILVRCLAFSLHMISALYIAMIIMRFLIEDVDSSSNVGLAITQSFLLSNFLDWGLRQWVMLESIMTSFQRADEYTYIEQETQAGQLMKDWPSQGQIEFKNLSLTYKKNNETVLKHLNFIINPKEKIGVVGRTGAGKSSIILALFRLYESDGEIIIDDMNIKTVSLEYLRNQVALIPQDPMLFTGTVRSNIDPLRKYSDNEIWLALNAVNLKSSIKNLDEDIHESGLTHSVGQKQLLCLARAIVKKTKIIILDEATANMDEETDNFVHNKISELFAEFTTITVAHRLHSVMKCDRVIVMDKGEVIEFDSPSILLQNVNSAFYKMVHHHDNS